MDVVEDVLQIDSDNDKQHVRRGDDDSDSRSSRVSLRALLGDPPYGTV